ncbi:hypothetical protein C3L33_10466, partial [Rhododendron williamsianum]
MGLLDIKIQVQEDDRWRNRRNKLRNLKHTTNSNPTSSSSNTNTHTNAKKPTTMDLDLYKATIKGDVDRFIRVSADKHLSLSSLFDQTTPLANSYLHVAAAFGHQDLVHFIASHSPSLIAARNAKGDTPLHAAARSGRYEAVCVLKRFAEDSPACSSEAAAEGGVARATLNYRTLLRSRNREGNTALHEAMTTMVDGDMDCGLMVKYLIRSGGEVPFVANNEGKSPFYLAAEYGKGDLVELMLQICIDGGYYSNSEDIKGNVSQHHSPSLFLGMLEIILEKMPIFILLRDEDWETPLHCAASEGYYEGVQYLLEKFSDSVLERDRYGIGFLPVHTASRKGHLHILRKLLQYCPDWRELLTNEGENILHVAARYGKSNVIDYILKTPEHEKLLNERDDSGNTPLHLAAINWNPKVVSSLTWDKRINLELVNGRGMTALDAAEDRMDMMVSGYIPQVITTSRCYSFCFLEIVQRLTWMALKSAGAPNRKCSQVPKLITQTSLGYQQPNMENYKDRINTLLLVATLVATVTYAAGFTMPGGYNNSNPNQGMATMLNKSKFQIFVICDTIAMFSSMIVAVSLIWAQLGDLNLILTSLRLALPLLGLALSMMSLAFMAGVYLVVSTLTWLANVVLIMGIVFLSILLVLFIPLFFPATTTFPVIRHISYYFFCLMMLASGSYREDEEE